jgi:hypothetical protein
MGWQPPLDRYSRLCMSTLAENLHANMIQLSVKEGVDPLLVTSIYQAWINLQPAYKQSTIFTDDLAPIEWITNDMVLNYVLFGDVENIQ